MRYMPDTKVQYIGEKFAKELAGTMGWVIAEVERDPGKYVVEFGGDDYILPVAVLAPFKEVVKKEEKNNDKVGGVEIRRNRRRASEDE